MMDVKSLIKNGTSAKVTRVVNAPAEYNDRTPQYFGNETAKFISEYAQYATDMFTVQTQGLDENAFYEWSTRRARISDLFVTTMSTSQSESYKKMFFEDPSIGWIGLGAKVKTMGRIYIVTNPITMSPVMPHTIMRRCNAVYGRLDYYGNAVYEPFVWMKEGATATTNDSQDYLINAVWYQHSIIQKNANTEDLHINSKFVLGSSVYAIRGFVDFEREFVEDADSTHLLMFDLYRMEPTEYDDMERGIANGKNFSWEIRISGNEKMITGTTQTLTAESFRNNVLVDETEHEVGYKWTSSDTDVATVDPATGEITSLSAGNCKITCRLIQNPEVYSEFELRVGAAETGGYVSFVQPAPQTLALYTSTTIEAAYFNDDVRTPDAITYSASGPKTRCYEMSSEDNKLTIKAWETSSIPLTITASCNGKSATTQIYLMRGTNTG